MRIVITGGDNYDNRDRDTRDEQIELQEFGFSI